MRHLTSGHDQVGETHGWGDKAVVSWLDKALILLQHVIDLPAALSDVTLQPASQTHVEVLQGEHGQIAEFADGLYGQGEDAVNDDHVNA